LNQKKQNSDLTKACIAAEHGSLNRIHQLATKWTKMETQSESAGSLFFVIIIIFIHLQANNRTNILQQIVAVGYRRSHLAN